MLESLHACVAACLCACSPAYLELAQHMPNNLTNLTLNWWEANVGDEVMLALVRHNPLNGLSRTPTIDFSDFKSPSHFYPAPDLAGGGEGDGIRCGSLEGHPAHPSIPTKSVAPTEKLENHQKAVCMGAWRREIIE